MTGMVKVIGALLAVALVASLVKAHPWLLVVLVPLALLLFDRPGTASAGRMVTGHAHGGRPSVVARHEAGHVAVARALGGSRIHAWSNGREGATSVRHHKGVAGSVAFSLGGRYAAGGAGCSADNADVRRVLREVPSKDRARVRREGERIARRAVSARRGQIKRDAATLLRKGRL